MIRICSKCPEANNVIGEIEPLQNKAKTHGLCRYHFLESAHEHRIATRAEEQEYYRLSMRR